MLKSLLQRNLCTSQFSSEQLCWPKRRFYSDFWRFVLVLCILCKSIVIVGASVLIFPRQKVHLCFISKIPEEKRARESQREPERARENQRESQRESQREPERARESQSEPDREPEKLASHLKHVSTSFCCKTGQYNSVLLRNVKLRYFLTRNVKIRYFLSLNVKICAVSQKKA